MEFTVQNKSFKNDIQILLEGLRCKEKFAFSKYADGEFAILRNKRIQNCDGWIFDPLKHNKEHLQLLKSFSYKDNGYYVGISCPCCVSNEHVKWMKETVRVKKENLTWANIFVNSNYEYFKNHFFNEFRNHSIVLFANEKSNYKNLPFEVETFVPITNTAWVDNFNLIDEFEIENYNNKLFLFCAGPLGNMLTHAFWIKNKFNTYLDIGSTLNPWIVGNNRGYLRDKITKTCIWEK